MDLKALDVCYNSIELFLSLVSIFNFNFNRQYSSPNCHSKSCHVGKHHRAPFKPNFEPFECFGRVYYVHKTRSATEAPSTPPSASPLWPWTSKRCSRFTSTTR